MLYAQAPACPPFAAQATIMQKWAMRILELLPPLAESLANIAATSPAAQAVAQRCRAAAAGLRVASQPLRECTPVEVAQAYPGQLEPAAQAAGAALEAFGELPEHGNEQLLDLAISAGMRSCAYLRCAAPVAAVRGEHVCFVPALSAVCHHSWLETGTQKRPPLCP